MERSGDRAIARFYHRFYRRFSRYYDLLIRFVPGWSQRLEQVIPRIKGPRVLEVSFGTGYLLSRYRERFQSVGLEYNQAMLDTARAALPGASLVRGDAHALPFPDESFDSLVNTDAFSLYLDPEKAMAEFYRVLTKGGRLLLMEMHDPRDGNWLGQRLMIVPRICRLPARDYDDLLSGVGFEVEDLNVGLRGVLHLYVATKT